MAENETAPTSDGQASAEGAGGQATEATTTDAPQAAARPDEPQGEPVPPEEITYHAVEKDGEVSAIWEMQGRKHLRTIDPRSRQGLEILRLYTAENQ
ncbi:MAG: hypothetical protein QOE33_2406 [Acidobacteriota bacterium]|nr:hypothetical protein [Acidobacteriota bacterium]